MVQICKVIPVPIWKILPRPALSNLSYQLIKNDIMRSKPTSYAPDLSVQSKNVVSAKYGFREKRKKLFDF